MTKKSKPSPAVSPGRKSLHSRKEIAELKVKALKMVDEGMGPREIGKALNVSESVVGAWRTAAGHAPIRENLTEADKARIIEMWGDGKFDRQIAGETGFHVSTIQGLYGQLRTEPRKNSRPKHSEATKKRAVALVETGKSFNAVGKEIGASPETVERWYTKALADGTAKLVERSKRSEDLQLRWVTREFPQLESWRTLAAEWVSEQKNLALVLRSLPPFLIAIWWVTSFRLNQRIFLRKVAKLFQTSTRLVCPNPPALFQLTTHYTHLLSGCYFAYVVKKMTWVNQWSNGKSFAIQFPNCLLRGCRQRLKVLRPRYPTATLHICASCWPAGPTLTIGNGPKTLWGSAVKQTTVRSSQVLHLTGLKSPGRRLTRTTLTASGVNVAGLTLRPHSCLRCGVQFAGSPFCTSCRHHRVDSKYGCWTPVRVIRGDTLKDSGSLMRGL